MIRVFLLLLSTIAAAWYVADALESKGPGYVWLSYNNYSIETTFWFFIGLLIAIACCVFILIKTLQLCIYLLKQCGLISKNWGVSKSELFMTQFRLAYADQHWKKADDAFQKGMKKSALYSSDHIMAIRTALHLNKFGEAKSRVHQLKQQADVNELSVRILELDIAIAEKNSGLGLSLYSQLLKDYPKEENLKANALDYFMQLKAFDKAESVYSSMGRSQKKQHRQQHELIALAKVKKASNVDVLKPLLKHIQKLNSELQIELITKSNTFDTILSQKYLIVLLKHQQFDVLSILDIFELNESEALDLLKSIEGVIKQENANKLTASMLAGLAELNCRAKLFNKAADIYQQSLLLSHSDSVFKQYINTLKQHKSNTEMNAAIIQYATKMADS